VEGWGWRDAVAGNTAAAAFAVGQGRRV